MCKNVFLSNFGISSVPSLQRRNKRSVWYAPVCSLLLRPQGAKSLPTRWGGGRAQRWPEGLCPFSAARSLTSKLRAGHARPLLAMARCRVAAGAGGYGIRPPRQDIGRKGNNNEVPRASNARPYIVLQFIKTKTPPALAGKRCLFIKLSD